MSESRISDLNYVLENINLEHLTKYIKGESDNQAMSIWNRIILHKKSKFLGDFFIKNLSDIFVN